MTIVTFDTIELETLVKNEINKINFEICNYFNINKQLIDDNILQNWKLDLSIISDANLVKEKKKRPINPANFCLARKPNLERCTRNKKIGSNFCASHQFNHPYGRIDDNKPFKSPKNVKHKQKRKNKDKSKDKSKTDKGGGVDKGDTKNDESREIKRAPKKIKLKSIIIGDIEYYIDQYQHIYLKNYIDNQLKYKFIGVFDKVNNKIDIK